MSSDDAKMIAARDEVKWVSYLRIKNVQTNLKRVGTVDII